LGAVPCVNAFRGRLVALTEVESVGFSDLRGWLSWLAVVSFGCGVAPMWLETALCVTAPAISFAAGSAVPVPRAGRGISTPITSY
jgi:hypothetical protein